MKHSNIHRLYTGVMTHLIKKFKDINYRRSGNIREGLIFANFTRGQISEFKNLAEIIILIALLKKNANSRILNFVKSPKIKLAKIQTRKNYQIYSIQKFEEGSIMQIT